MIEVQNQLEIKPETAIAQNRCYVLGGLSALNLIWKRNEIL